MQPAVRYVYDFDAPPDLDEAERTLLLGGKGANLTMMAGPLGLPVPPGFTITTEACRAYLSGSWPEGLDAEISVHLDRLAQRAGRRFGDPANPLLLSVRSGAPVSMPGMMDTILNLGLNPVTVVGLARATGDADFAADCLRRFRQSYTDVIGAGPPEDPWAQLRAAIEAVFRSWNSDRARAYRAREAIPDDLGTAVTVQQMVFGNSGPDSATGVLFTRNPSTGEPELYGDVMFNAQGEDVVAGTHATEPIAVLDARLPAVASELRKHARVLEHHLADLCDIEFTIEDGRLWLLQVRAGKRSPRAALRMAIDMADDETFPLSREEAVRRVAPLLADPPRVFVRGANASSPIAVGLPASPGVASGMIVTSSEAAERAAEEGKLVILVRSETSPEDVRGMSNAAGILTARGGLASHAAVVARGWGIPAVVGASAVVPGETSVSFGGRVMSVGEGIAIDGSTGEVFANEVPGRSDVAPEVATLLDWAREFGVAVRQQDASEIQVSTSYRVAYELPDPTAHDVIVALAIKGTATFEQLIESLSATADAVTPLVDRQIAGGAVERSSDALRLTAQGKLISAELFTEDQEAIGEARASDLLDEFHELDARMKSIVTAWQVRDLAGEQVLNDHADSDYDAGVIASLEELSVDTAVWLDPLVEPLRRYGSYRARLSRASRAAADGDQRFVASPRVDSFHSVWFELHEDLIRLAGRKRSDEAAAGRA